jgi:clan AA aspartic protease (TIGR02281 family)
MRVSWLLAIACTSISLFAPTAALADQQSAESALKEKGLKRFGANFCVPEEQELTKLLKDMRVVQKDLAQAEKALVEAESQASHAKEYLQECFRQRAALTRQLTQTRNAKQHNQIVAQINQLEAEIVTLQDGEAMEKALEEARATTSAERERYTQGLLDARALVTKAEAQYQELAVDPEVVTLIDEYNKDAARDYALGPSRPFAASVKALAKLEEKVLSEVISLRREGRLFFVDVVFNGDAANTREMAIDTGASIVSLPYALAKSVGLEPDENSEVLRMEMADGSIVPARKVFAKELRVGKFIAEDVECVVMPEDLPNAAPLLGQTFLEKFGYRIDSDQQKLIMTQVKKEEEKPVRGGRR